jgi:polysaccharide export outer membrane protein
MGPTMGLIRYLVLLCILWVPLAACAQGGLVARPPAAAEYVLGNGDEIVIHVVDMEDEIPEKPLRIDPNGDVDIPLAGRFHATGLTLDQFKTELTSRLTKYVNNPRISVNLTDERSRSVSIIGAFVSPGSRQLQGPARLIEVLSLGGGTRAEAGPRVIITREQKWGKIPLPDATVDPTTGTSTASVSLDDLQASKNPSENILMMPNDIVYVPKAEVVYVMGNVRKSGGFQLSTHPTISLIQAIALAEGMDNNARPDKAKILRQPQGGDGKPKEIPVDITMVLAGKAPDVALQGNDILYVPNSGVKSGSRRVVEAIIQAATGVAVYRFYVASRLS